MERVLAYRPVKLAFCLPLQAPFRPLKFARTRMRRPTPPVPGTPSRRLPWTLPLGSFSEMAYFARIRSPNSARDKSRVVVSLLEGGVIFTPSAEDTLLVGVAGRFIFCWRVSGIRGVLLVLFQTLSQPHS
jgi:hypothetical protein